MPNRRSGQSKRPKGARKLVKLYTTPTCPWCKVARAHLKDNDISFIEIDVSHDRAGLREMLTMTGQHGVPVLLIGEKALIGWNPAEFDRLYRL